MLRPILVGLLIFVFGHTAAADETAQPTNGRAADAISACKECDHSSCSKGDASACATCEHGKCLDCAKNQVVECDGDKCNCEKKLAFKCDENDCLSCEGCQDRADRGVKAAVLEQKLAELAQLQNEIRQLQRETGRGQQIRVSVQMLEVSLTKLQRLGVDYSELTRGTLSAKKLSSLQELTEVVQSSYKPDSSEKQSAGHTKNFIEWLKDNNLAKEVSNPKLVTLEGRPASVSIGSEVPVPKSGEPNAAIDFQPVGTQLEILPIAMPDNRVRLEVRARISEASDWFNVNGEQVPSFKVRKCDTAVVSKFGETTVLNGIVEERTRTVKRDSGKTEDEIQKIALLLVVTPEPADSPAIAERPASRKITK
jgi:hypothetical protein